MKKVFLCIVLMAIAVGFIFAEGTMETTENESQKSPEFSNQYIDLQGEWHFKVYRKYNKMFQYFNYGGVEVTWENIQDAQLPTSEVYTEWETVKGPNDDYSTGGLLQMNRGTGMGTEDDRTTLTDFDLFPKWSEAWFCKTVTIPKGYIKGESVTLLLGIIDDLDVVYVNGTPVAASGFITPERKRSSPASVPDIGGFTPGGDFSFETSYWEVPREYTIDADLLHEGANELCIRLYNNNSFGGFYDETMALVFTPEALRYLKGKPVDRIVNDTEFMTFVDTQTQAIEAEDISAYAETLSADYVQNEVNKTEQVVIMTDIFKEYTNIQVIDKDAGCFNFEGDTVYSAQRVIQGERDGKTENILEEDNFLIYFSEETGQLKERGNWSHCYTVDYISKLEGMNNTQQTYSIYLPPSYYSEPYRTFPVVYLLHGINSSGDSFVNVDNIEENMNSWIEEGSVVEMIVVMPNSGKRSGYTDTEAPKGPNDSQGPWASHIYIDMVSEVERNFRTLVDSRFRGISGISMGGGGVFKVGVAHPEIFTSFASHMGAVPEVAPYFETMEPELLSTLDFYLDCGMQDHMVDPERTAAAGEFLESIGANVYWELRDGGHNSAFYMDGLPHSMTMHSEHFIKNGLIKTSE